MHGFPFCLCFGHLFVAWECGDFLRVACVHDRGVVSVKGASVVGLVWCVGFLVMLVGGGQALCSRCVL